MYYLNLYLNHAVAKNAIDYFGEVTIARIRRYTSESLLKQIFGFKFRHIGAGD
jgi:hypothetical protein